MLDDLDRIERSMTPPETISRGRMKAFIGKWKSVRRWFEGEASGPARSLLNGNQVHFFQMYVISVNAWNNVDDLPDRQDIAMFRSDVTEALEILEGIADAVRGWVPN